MSEKKLKKKKKKQKQGRKTRDESYKHVFYNNSDL